MIAAASAHPLRLTGPRNWPMLDAPLPTEGPKQFVRLSGLKRYFDVSAPWLVRKLEGRPRQIVQAVHGGDIEIAKGETFSLVGESGCGKSPVARLVVGLYAPAAGPTGVDATPIPV